ncbi:bifunctional apoptosis regulator-like [Dendronephthya gigantea]|uniref:bifunctional apoptosis regulator-like n=1 Tax=Dendronephthya gigantea TaxID=151771 RepID=UPI00106976A0|nr:bifunctional apoptosis regulator-like [Dendronephthya gigantea]XP_028406703.1 bifunctional apoptosis regulator-like [Dendronephthya gigantea]XP_028406704.1 bifunctional apoptosis regulator-like [Dendronephthya gigantea]
MVSLEELECGCCYELLLNPTTLTCGHSFCRYCLAKWFKTSKKAECPECRQTWIGFPSVNVHLRSIIEKSFPAQVNIRTRSQTNVADYEDVLKDFEEHGKGDGGRRNAQLSQEQLNGFIGAFILVIIALLIVLLIVVFYWIIFTEAKPAEVIYSKSAQSWTVREVASWAQGFTDQLSYDYSERFSKAGINGELMLSLNEKDLASDPLNILSSLHRKIIMAEIDKLNLAGVKQPKDIWEYKDAHRISSIFLLFMLQDFPRLTIFLHRFMWHDTVFMPFMRTVAARPQCEQKEFPDDYLYDDNDDSEGESKCSSQTMILTSRDKVWFYIKAMFVPYYLFSQFAWHFTDVQFFTMWIIISHCIMLTVREALLLKKANISLRTIWGAIIDATISFAVTSLIYSIAVWFIPAIIMDFCFFAKLYYGPLDTAGSIRNGHLKTNAIGKILDVIFGAINSVVRFIGTTIRDIRGRRV